MLQVCNNKRALLVGCTYDEMPEDYHLNGTKEDARSVGCLLKHVFGFHELKFLLGKEATHKNILDGFKGSQIETED